MSDPRVLAWLRKIDTSIELLRSEREVALEDVHHELEVHEQQLAAHADQLAKHDDDIADHERRLKRLENGRARR